MYVHACVCVCACANRWNKRYYPCRFFINEQGACGHHANAWQRSCAWWWKPGLITLVYLLFNSSFGDFDFQRSWHGDKPTIPTCWFLFLKDVNFIEFLSLKDVISCLSIRPLKLRTTGASYDFELEPSIIQCVKSICLCTVCVSVCVEITCFCHAIKGVKKRHGDPLVLQCSANKYLNMPTWRSTTV